MSSNLDRNLEQRDIDVLMFIMEQGPEGCMQELIEEQFAGEPMLDRLSILLDNKLLYNPEMIVEGDESDETRVNDKCFVVSRLGEKYVAQYRNENRAKQKGKKKEKTDKTGPGGKDADSGDGGSDGDDGDSE